MSDTKKQLAQTTITTTTMRKLDALARADGTTRAGYLRRLIDMHVRAINPKLLKAIAQPIQDSMLRRVQL